MIAKNRFKIICLFFLFFSSVLFAQQDTVVPPQSPREPEKERIPFKDRLFIDASVINLQFGNPTSIGVTPIIGYRVTDKFTTGISVTYLYYRERGYNYTYKNNVYGGSVFGRYYILEGLFAQVEPELLNTKVFDPIDYSVYRKNILSLFVGGGYIQKIGDNSGIYLMVLYNLNDTPESPYQDPLIRLGFNFGL